ncbi:hypothetical protein GQ607_015910 [Colletotrichum asianum]|uniref:Uncharacterized protein n=1 Tax=Colletotrichum asianum TaxID=702518 RepID=A0A8H3W0E3_9PEZI|nr:hypothetical protein GQ607_015910 [Colletotrichum asianum]
MLHNLCPILLDGSPWVDIKCLGDGKLVESTVIAEILRAGHHIFPFSTILLDPILFKGEAVPDGERRTIDAEPTTYSSSYQSVIESKALDPLGDNTSRARS